MLIRWSTVACDIGEADTSKTLLGLYGGDGACWQTRDDRVNASQNCIHCQPDPAHGDESIASPSPQSSDEWGAGRGEVKPSRFPFPPSAFGFLPYAALKNQFNAPFQSASCDRLNRRRPSTSAMNKRAESSVARCRVRLQNDKYPTIASRYARRSKSLSRTLARTPAQLGNQAPSEGECGFIRQILIQATPLCLSKSDMATQKSGKHQAAIEITGCK